ncbi:hypothetical protein C4D60_Mb09t04660 [Musa balbisiana]|uniref:Uncharacterized protein n=1 Tax=Musa balbisiana TaxID=52838 RepID=A0A4S8IE58_MUSBA|nr:hypothetical protein C4D60_Mb09t04660 [Musa balbisiana]
MQIVVRSIRVVGSELSALRTALLQIATTRNGGYVFSPSQEKIQQPVSRYRFFVIEPHLSAALLNGHSPVRKHRRRSEGLLVT